MLLIKGLEISPTQYQDKSSTIFTLLPLTHCSQLVSKEQKGKFLHLINAILSVSLRGLNEFINGNLNQFDAQISENLCQIRAYHITFLARKYLQSSENKNILQSNIAFLIDYQKKIESVIKDWNEAVQTASCYDKKLDAQEHAGDFLERNSLSIELKSDIIYLSSCYLLARFSTKVDGILQSISLEWVTKELHISKSQAKKLVHLFQHNVCALGLDFVNLLLDDLPQLAHYKKILPELIKDSGDSRLVLPCFVASDIVFNHALITQTPICLSVCRRGSNIRKEEIIYFLIKGNELLKSMLIDEEEYLFNSCMVIEGEVNYEDKIEIEPIEEYIERLLEIDPIQVLLANTAMHPQYAGSKLHALTDNPYLTIANSLEKQLAEYTFNKMKDFASVFGCHKTNASTLFMKHAYSDFISNQINTLQHVYQERAHNANEKQVKDSLSCLSKVKSLSHQSY